ncbi:MAG: BCCT family transporter, partial [Wenzhouxiangellaceae bacterium]
MNDEIKDVQAAISEINDIYDTDYQIGEDNFEKWGFDLHSRVFVASVSLIFAFVVLSLSFPDGAKESLEATRGWIQQVFDWMFLSVGNLFVLFCLALIVLPSGRIRLGGEDARPAFSTLSWFAMLFAAGMGIGLMFWSVAEPVGYFTEWFGTPLNTPGFTEEAKTAAMGATMYHWGLHPWAIYGVVGLSLAFFSFNKGLPLTMRSTFYPLLGERVWGGTGDVIDTLAVVATIFGLATSMGLGAQQAAGGIAWLMDIGGGLQAQILIIIGVTIVAIFSVVRGIDGGVKLLSNINMILALSLLMFIIFAGSVSGMFSNLGTTFKGYFQYLLPLSNPVGRDDETFYHSWTIFYWAWWISWSPFVGMFIARVSRGRTVREFLTAVLLVPTLVTTVWMSAFGGTGIDQV